MGNRFLSKKVYCGKLNFQIIWMAILNWTYSWQNIFTFLFILYLFNCLFILKTKISIWILFFCCSTCSVACTFGVLFPNSLHNYILNGSYLDSALHNMSCMKGFTSQQGPTLRAQVPKWRKESRAELGAGCSPEHPLNHSTAPGSI